MTGVQTCALPIFMRLYNREPQNAPVPAQPNVAPYRPIAQDVSNMPSTALFASLSPMMVHNVTTLANQITDVNTPAEVENIIGLVRSHSMGGWEDFVPQQREYLARTLQEYVDTQTQEQVGNIMADISMAMHESANMYSLPYALDTLDHIINNVRRGNLTELLENSDYASLLPGARDALLNELAELRNELENDHGNGGEPPQRRGPFQPGGSSAVRGLPLGSLNIRPSITASALRGPDVQPVRNFLQQVQNLPGVTQEGLRTGLMAFENMDPTRQISKADFVRELLPSSYDIVDLRGASQENQHVMDQAEEDFNDDPSPIAAYLGLTGREIESWSRAVLQHYNDFDSFPKIGRAHV